MTTNQTAADLQQTWETDERWKGVERDYSAADVVKLRGSVRRSSRSPAAAPSASGTSCTARTTSTLSVR